MAFIGDDIQLARETFEQLSAAIGNAPADGRRYWELVGHMQALCRQGFLPARAFMARIDVSAAPAGFDRRTPVERTVDPGRPASPRGARSGVEPAMLGRPPRRRTTDRFTATRWGD